VIGVTTPISGIAGFSGIEGIEGIGGPSWFTDAAETTGSAAPQGPNADFAGMLAKGIENVQSAQTKAADLAVQVADGTLKDPAQYTMAATEASLGLQLTMAIRNKAVEAFQEIMRMQA
jgi:flagellar hook-basal body complex protein FliE